MKKFYARGSIINKNPNILKGMCTNKKCKYFLDIYTINLSSNNDIYNIQYNDFLAHIPYILCPECDTPITLSQKYLDFPNEHQWKNYVKSKLPPYPIIKVIFRKNAQI